MIECGTWQLAGIGGDMRDIEIAGPLRLPWLIVAAQLMLRKAPPASEMP